MKNKAFSLLELAIVIVIIGLLTLGITAGQRLINKGKLSRARMLTSSAPVAGIDGLRLWLEPTLADSITEDSNGVLQWNDLAPYNMDAVRESATGPTISTNEINGLPALDVTLKAMKVTDFSPLFKSSTIFIVFKTPSSLSTIQFVFSSSPYANTLGAGVSSITFQILSNGSFTVQLQAAGRSVVGGSLYYKDSTAFIATIMVPLGDYVKFYLNGILLGTASTATDIDNYGAYGDRMYIGDPYPDRDSFCTISEIIVYDNVLPDDERQEVEEYLSKKYDIELGS